MSFFSQLFGRATTLPSFRAFDAGKHGRRLRSVPTSQAAINSQIQVYGKTIIARSRYLAANNPLAAAAKETFVSALTGSGIKPSPLIDKTIKDSLLKSWRIWTDEADADGLTDFYGLEAMIAAEMFEAGECFIRFRPRKPVDGMTVPLQLQLIPSEMCPMHKTEDFGGRRVVCGIEFDAIGKRTAYKFYRSHPDDTNLVSGTEFVSVPASEILHLYRPIRAGQVRGLPHTLSSIVKLAIYDQYDDAELERKRSAALFAAFVRRPLIDDGEHPMQATAATTAAGTIPQPQPTSSWALEPGATIDLEPGEEIQFSQPADVGASYEAFQYRQLLSVAAGFGVPYSAMTGDLRQTSYSSIRAGIIEFRRRIEAMQNHIMIYQFCRPVWRRWLTDAVMSQSVEVSPADLLKRQQEFFDVKWITPKWEWVDPLKDLQAEELAVKNMFKSRSDVIEAIGDDREATDLRIAEDRESAAALPEDPLAPKPPAPAVAPGEPKKEEEDDEPPRPE